MKSFPPILAGLLVLGALSGCGQKTKVEVSVSQLEKAFPDGNANPSLQIAIAATRNHDFVSGVVALSSAKQVPGLTAEQLMAVEQASRSITTELARRADSGDAAARADLQRIERTRSQ